MTRTRSLLLTVLALVALVGSTVPAAATSEPSSDLLLPWFEVHLTDARTTLFAIGNSAEEPVDVRISVATNWGIPVIERTVTLEGGEVKTVNLRDWVVTGDVPEPKLAGLELEHVQAALTGQPSPKDDLFYATQADPFDPELATGYVTFRVVGNPRPDVLWGDYFWVDPGQDFAEGELLVNIDRSSPCGDLCDLHRMRFIDGAGFDGGTKLVVWSPKRLQPAPDANAATVRNLLTLSGFHKEPGEKFDERMLELLPVQLIDVRDLMLDENFGWLDMASDDEIYVGVRYSASHRYSVTLQTWCLPEPPPERPKKADIDIEKSTNGLDADEPPGYPAVGDDPITWEYVVTNTGAVTLTDVEVSDDQEGAVSCPKSTLEPGEVMTCTLSGVAPPQSTTPFQYANMATVTGTPAEGRKVSDKDPSHYRVPAGTEPGEPLIGVEKTTNGVQADTGNGPELAKDQAVTWEYVVTNNGGQGLENVQLTDDREGAISCPKTTLAIGESMTCTKAGIAQVGEYHNVATVQGTGIGSGITVSDTDPSAYHVPDLPPAIDVEKATNGDQADTGSGPELAEGDAVTWSYVVTNTGEEALENVQLTDDREGAISCPKTTLAIGESMTCTKAGIAQVGEYHNVATVQGTGVGSSTTVSDSDPSAYHVPEPPVGQGCTPGYWKNHTDSWPITGYSPAQSVESVFSAAAAYPAYGSASLLQALSFQGGSTLEGAVGNLLRAAVAGLLDSAHPDVNYPRNTAALIADVDAALASGDRDTMLSLASQIDQDNNLGCPLN
jgi:hypothetical protein